MGNYCIIKFYTESKRAVDNGSLIKFDGSSAGDRHWLTILSRNYAFSSFLYRITSTTSDSYAAIIGPDREIYKIEECPEDTDTDKYINLKPIGNSEKYAKLQYFSVDDDDSAILKFNYEILDR